MIRTALAEDRADHDVTTLASVPKELECTAIAIAKTDCVIAGVEMFAETFRMLDKTIGIEILKADGTPVKKGEVIANVSGNAGAILSAERTALNFLQRASGIATRTREFVVAVEGTKAKILDTRKTAPLLRDLDRMAVRAGGGINHRHDLSAMILLKDNHIAAAGGTREALRRGKEYAREHASLAIEIETETLEDVRIALSEGGATRIMLDNFSLELMKAAVKLIDGRVEVEASGGVNLETVRAIAETGVDFISVGELTHSVKATDISLEIVK